MPTKNGEKFTKLQTLKSAFRRDWNGVNPVTKVDKVKKKYNRKRDRKIPTE